ncbi:MAG: AAA family ATPase [Nitratireductor sp.]|nr:AAA family ATPase [Nitratireductor sp.]
MNDASAVPFFSETTMVREIQRRAHFAMQGLNPVLVIGSAGTGKTEALRHLSNVFPRSCVCTVDPADRSPLGMVTMLRRSMGFREQGRYHRDIRHEVVSTLHELRENPCVFSGRIEPIMFLVDEVNNLEPRALKDLLDIVTTTGHAMVMAGNQESLSRSDIGKRKISIHEFEQIKSRIGMKIDMLPPSSSDLVSIASKPFFRLRGERALQGAVNYGLGRDIRQMVEVLKLAGLLAGEGKPVQADHLWEAVEGRDGAEGVKIMERKAA